jgi:hypothetical protein
MKYTLSLVVALIFLGCASKTIMPLASGNEWHYRWGYFGPNGDTVLRQENYVYVLQDTEIRNERWYLLGKKYGNLHNTQSFALNRADGLYKFSSVKGAPRIDVPYPAITGSSTVWRDTFSADFIDIDSLYLQATDWLVTVPAGTFRTYFFRHLLISGTWLGSPKQRSDTVYSEEYYTPGIGMIQAYYYGDPQDKSKPNEEVLVDYKLK